MSESRLVMGTGLPAPARVPTRRGTEPGADSCLPLPDGAHVFVRPMVARDARALHRFLLSLSPRTLYRRFFSQNLDVIERTLCPRLMQLDYHDRYALVALDGDEVVGVARYHRQGTATEAEVAIVLRDAWQRRGLGKLLMAQIAGVAADHGVEVFIAEVLGENRPALALMHAVFERVTFRFDHGDYVGRAEIGSRRRFAAAASARD